MSRRSYQGLINKILKFNKARGWTPTSSDLAKSVVIEASVLLEHFQWDESDRGIKGTQPKRWEEISEEVADVFWYLVMFCSASGIDLHEAVEDKIKKNNKKYPVEKFKILTSKVWELFVYILFGLHVKDIDCGFKFVSKKVVDVVPKLESERGAFISSEFLIKAKKSRFKIVEIGITHLPRSAGSGTGRDLNVIINSFKDLFSLWKKLR